MKISRFEAVGRCLLWKEKKILVIGDLHLGYEDYLQEAGWSFPKTQMQESEKILNKILKKIGKVEKIILLGDVKHYFGGILSEEFGDFYKIIEILGKKLEKNGKIIITRGNHDNILEPIVKNYKKVELVDYYVEEDAIFFHGSPKNFKDFSSILRKKEIKVIICGHFHPAVLLEKGEKKEKYKCFLHGRDSDLKKEIVILPSFFPLVEGSNILMHAQLEKKKILNFKVYLVDEEDNVYDFGKVKDFEIKE